MKRPSLRIFRRLEDWSLLQRLDRVPFSWALAVGGAIGLTISVGIFLRPSVMVFVGAGVVMVFAGALAWSAQPVGCLGSGPRIGTVVSGHGVDQGRFVPHGKSLVGTRALSE